MRAKLTSSRNTVSELGIASPVHLRAGLSGAAYEAVRKLEHTKLKTKDDKGSPTDAGMRLFLETLRENIAATLPQSVLCPVGLAEDYRDDAAVHHPP